MENNELYHYGIKKMRWGIRRYQNKDGSLTPAGQKRYNKEMDALKAEEKVLKTRKRTAAKINKLQEKRKELDEMKKDLDSNDNISNKRKLFSKKADPETEIEEVVKSKKQKIDTKPTKKDIKNMSDEELNALLDRINLEKRASEAVSQQNKGKEFIVDVLKKSGSNVATQFATYAMGYAVNKAFAKTFGDPAIINPKKGQKDK